MIIVTCEVIPVKSELITVIFLSLSATANLQNQKRTVVNCGLVKQQEYNLNYYILVLRAAKKVTNCIASHTNKKLQT